MIIHFLKKGCKVKRKVTGIVDRMFDDLQLSLSRELPGYLYYFKVSEVRKSFYVLIRKMTGTILGASWKEIFENVKI